MELTELGKREAARLAVQREEANKNLFAVLTDEEKQQLENILGKLTPYWHEEFDQGGEAGGRHGGHGDRDARGDRGDHAHHGGHRRRA